MINRGNLKVAMMPPLSLDTLCLLYSGSIYRGRGIENLPETPADLFTSVSEIRQRVCLALAGGTITEVASGVGDNYLDQLKVQIAEFGLVNAINRSLNLTATDIPCTIQAHRVMVLSYCESKRLGLLG